MSKRLWIVEVRGKNQKYGYPMDSTVFKRKKDAVEHMIDHAWPSSTHIYEVVELARKETL